MKVAVFDTHKFDRQALEAANAGKHELIFLEGRLDPVTARLAAGCPAICCFTNDRADAQALNVLYSVGVRLVALRSAGYNHVDLKRAQELGITVVRVPAYSPYAVAEYAAGLLLCLNRKIHKAHNRIHELNFSLEGLMGFDLHGKTVGILGTGRIGRVFGKIMHGFGCHILAYDKAPDSAWAQTYGATYVGRDFLFQQSDIISLHVPLNQETRHLIDDAAIKQMKKEVLLINTGRGGLIDTAALIRALKSHAIAGAALDVYEEEEGIFFSDFSQDGIDDDKLARLLTFPHVLITSHQAFFTQEALKNIAETTIQSIDHFENKTDLGEVLVKL